MSDVLLSNTELENKIVATFLLDDMQRKFFIKTIPHQAFYWEKNSRIIKCLQLCERNNEPTDIVYIANKLNGQVSPIDLSIMYDPSLQVSPPTLEWGIGELKSLFYSRTAYHIAEKIQALSIKGDRSRIIKVASALSSLSDKIFSTEKVDHFNNATERVNSPDEYISTCFGNLNSLIGGFTRKDVSSIGGKSGHNKTTFTVFMGKEGLKAGKLKKLLYISADEPGEMIARRLIASEMNISLTDMRNKHVKLHANEVTEAVQKVYAGKLIIRDDILVPEEICAAILDYKPDQVVIDYIQELDLGTDLISDGVISRTLGQLKNASRKAGANLFILSQVRDKLIDERIEDKIPRPHDFLYGSDMRRRSRELGVVYWPYMDTHDENMINIFDLYIWKSTYSRVGALRFKYEPDYAIFIPMHKSNVVQHQTSEQFWSDLE